MAVSIALSAWAGAVAWRDAATRRIPNRLLAVLLVPAIVVLLATGQGVAGSGLMSSLEGSAVATAVLLPGWLAHALGAGDVKFGAVAGLVLGLGRTAEMLVLAAVVLGTLSALVLIRAGKQARGQRIAAGPAIALAFVAELLSGPWLFTSQA